MVRITSCIYFCENELLFFKIFNCERFFIFKIITFFYKVIHIISFAEEGAREVFACLAVSAIAYSDSDSSSYGGDYKNFRQNHA